MASRTADSRPVHAVPPGEVWTVLGSRPEGRSAAEAAVRLARYGPNAILEVRGKPLVLRFLANFTHLMALLLWAGGLIGFLARMPQLGIAIWSVNLINGIFSFWQEYRAVAAAVTGADETNLVVTSLARFRFGVPRTIARVKNPRNAWMFTPEMGVDVALDQADLPAHLIAEEMSPGDMMTLLKLRKGRPPFSGGVNARRRSRTLRGGS